jgi:hypothetical protein
MWKSRVCNRIFTMGQGAGSRVGTGRFQAMGHTGFNLYSPTTTASLPLDVSGSDFIVGDAIRGGMSLQ